MEEILHHLQKLMKNPVHTGINKTQKVSRIYYINSRFVGFFNML